MNVVMLGGPETGKTSYAVCLYGGLVNDCYEDLKFVDVHDSVGLFNEDLERLARRESVERSQEEHGAERLGLTVALESKEHELWIPDRSGEALRGSINGRQWHTELLSELQSAEALLLFLSPLKVDRGLSTEAVALEPNPDEGDEVPKKWSESMMPTDVRSVDALQELHEITTAERIPIAVVVSAWDLSEVDSPGDWLHKWVPLLEQYLGTHKDLYPSALFGVSVQGAKFKENEEVPANEPDPWDRAHAVDAEGNEVEISAPLSWILQFSGGRPAGD